MKLFVFILIGLTSINLHAKEADSTNTDLTKCEHYDVFSSSRENVANLSYLVTVSTDFSEEGEKYDPIESDIIARGVKSDTFTKQPQNCDEVSDLLVQYTEDEKVLEEIMSERKAKNEIHPKMDLADVFKNTKTFQYKSVAVTLNH